MTATAVPFATPRAKARERRKHLRKGTLWHGELRTPAGVLACRVVNLSSRGAQLEVDGALTAGESVTLVMEPLGEFLGIIAWRRDGKAGLYINEHRMTRTEITLPRSIATETFSGDC